MWWAAVPGVAKRVGQDLATKQHQHLLVKHVWQKYYLPVEGFPDSSVGKEFTSNAGDPGSIPSLGRYSEGKDYPLQYSGLDSPWGYPVRHY